MQVFKSLRDSIFLFFENRIQPFPSEEPETPPDTLLQFFRHYTKGAGLQLSLLAFCAVSFAVIEVSLFAVLGQIVDWMTKSTPETFFQDYWLELRYSSLDSAVVTDGVTEDEIDYDAFSLNAQRTYTLSLIHI